MSAFRGGRGLNPTLPSFTPSNGQRGARPGSTSRGGAQNHSSRGARGPTPATRGRGRGSGTVAGRPRARTPQPAVSTGDPQQRFQQLKAKREVERKDAIRNGFLADPDKPRTLAEAITPTGTCPDMCAEYERLERIVQKDVWSQETRDDGTPDEARMVKKFRRAAAGIDEQLPSDLRPAPTLSKTCDYLFDNLIGNADLATVHHFVWDRTRAIRNDFSIQQITKQSDVEIAIDCYERIARFHILSLHQFAVAEKPYDKYDWYQEREQLDRTLLSLMQYYDDNRQTMQPKNEAEFRAYCIIFQIQDPIPDLEDRVSSWPKHIRQHPRVVTALDLYAAACNIMDAQGPLKPRAAHLVAREDWNAFFTKVESNQVSYLMACVAEVYFNMVRRQTLNGIWRASRRGGNDVVDFTIDSVTDLLRFDDAEQTRNFCEHYGFGFKDLPGQSDEILDLAAVQGRSFPEAAQGLSAQILSQSLVEHKRFGRAFPAVIRGYSFAQARNEGLVNEDDHVGFDEDMQMDGEEDTESLFVPNDNATASVATTQLPATHSVFGADVFSSMQNASQPKASSFNPFATTPAAPSASTTPVGSPFAPKTGLQDSVFAPKAGTSSSGFSAWGKPSTTPAWGKASAITAVPQAETTNPSTTSGFGQPSRETMKRSEEHSSAPSAANPSLTSSIHAPSAFSWNKGPAAVSPWSTPIAQSTSSTTQGTSIFASASEIALPTPAVSPTAQASPVPSQRALPTFNFSQPSSFTKADSAVPAETTTEVPQSLATAESTQKSKAAASAFPSFTFGNPKATEKAEPAAATASSSFFSSSKLPPPEAAATEQSKPIFSFTQANGPSTSDPQTDPSKVPLFQFSKPETEKSNDSITKPATTDPRPTSTSNKTSPQPPSQVPPTPLKSPTLKTSQLNQPKRRSPLSQSFSAEEDSSSSKAVPIPNFDSPPRFTSASGTSASPPERKSSSSISQPVSQQSNSTPEAIFDKLACEIVTDPDRGLLRQFVEYHARPVIMSVYDELYLVEMQEAADKFRQEKIAKRYGRRWRETSWRLRLARQGKEKREKRRTSRRPKDTTHQQHSRQLPSADAVDDFLKRQSVRVQQAAEGSSTPRLDSAMSRRNSFTSTASTALDAASEVSDTASLREKVRNVTVANYVDAKGRVSKPSTPAPSADAAHRRSHFLGYSLSKQRSVLGEATPRQSSRSTYFRMKALGLNPSGSGFTTPMGPPPLPAHSNIKKRARDEDESDLADPSPPHKKSRTPPQSSYARTYARMRSNSNISQSSAHSTSPAASVAPSFALSRAEQDEDLLARARAARQLLRDPSAGRSRSRANELSPAPTQSVSSDRARMQARLRAVERAENNLAQSISPESDIPAYRLRESRFVPREHYGRAIERAQENLASRSRAASHSITGEDRHTDSAGAEHSASMDVELSQMPVEVGSSLRSPASLTSTQPDESSRFRPGELILNQMTGFGRFSQPDDDHPPEQSIDGGDVAMASDMDVDVLETPHLQSFAPSPEVVDDFTQSNTFVPNMSTNTVALSPYLDIGYDISQHVDAPSTSYPELHAPQQPSAQQSNDSILIHYPDIGVGDHNIVDSTRQEITLGRPTDQTLDHSSPAALESMDAEPPNDLDQKPQESEKVQIDPELLGSREDQIIDAPSATLADENAAPEPTHAHQAPHLNFSNPFAALANGSVGSKSDPASEKSDDADEDEDQVHAQEVGEPNDEEAETSTISFKQQDDDHFVTNGIIQDQLQDAQVPEPEPATSFSSVAELSEKQQSITSSEPPPRRYHTRSRSRELSARPVVNGHPTSTLSSVASQNGHKDHLETVEEAVEEAVEENVGTATNNTVSQDSASNNLDQVATGPQNTAMHSLAREALNGRRKSVSDVDEDMANDDAEEDQSVGSSGGHDGSVSEAAEVDHRNGYVAGSASDDDDEMDDESISEDGEEGGEEYDEDDEGGKLDEYGEEYDEDEDDDEDEDEDEEEGMSPSQMQASGLIKGGTGQTAEDAFELSD